MHTVRNIIFDLGNVLMSLDYQRTRRLFQAMLHKDFHFEKGLAEVGPLYDKYQRGKINEAEFFNDLKSYAPQTLTNAQLREAWNSMLNPVPDHRLEMLTELRNDHRVFLLTNTNYTHMNWFDHLLQEAHGWGLDEFKNYFDRTYFSYLLGMRKPDPEIYSHILTENDLEPWECLYIDDKINNVEGAESVGLLGYCHNPEEDIAEVMPNLLSEERSEI